jgi:hypothetical protein
MRKVIVEVLRRLHIRLLTDNTGCHEVPWNLIHGTFFVFADSWLKPGPGNPINLPKAIFDSIIIPVIR